MDDLKNKEAIRREVARVTEYGCELFSDPFSDYGGTYRCPWCYDVIKVDEDCGSVVPCDGEVFHVACVEEALKECAMKYLIDHQEEAAEAWGETIPTDEEGYTRWLEQSKPYALGFATDDMYDFLEWLLEQ